MVRLPFLKKKKKVFIRLTGKGGRNLVLGTFEVSNMEEILGIIQKKYEELGDTIKHYQNIRIIDIEKGSEVKIPNPFYEYTEDTQHGKSTSSEDFSIDLAKAMINLVFATNTEIVKELGRGLGLMVRGVIEGMGEMLKEALSINKPSDKITLQDVLEILGVIRELVGGQTSTPPSIPSTLTEQGKRGEG